MSKKFISDILELCFYMTLENRGPVTVYLPCYWFNTHKCRHFEKHAYGKLEFITQGDYFVTFFPLEEESVTFTMEITLKTNNNSKNITDASKEMEAPD